MADIEKNIQGENSWRTSTDSPTATGFVVMGLTLMLFSFNRAQLMTFGDNWLASVLFYGGGLQILAGLYEWTRRCVFGAVAFTSFGFFWLSLIALFLSPMVGWSGEHRLVALACYMIFWGLFSGLLFMGTLNQSRATRLPFALFSLFLLLEAASLMTGVSWVRFAAHFAGISCGGLLVLLALRHRWAAAGVPVRKRCRADS
ncbi:MAG: GPR1/FUN34/YaaH family transporter [Geothermobacteraceae bacterium]